MPPKINTNTGRCFQQVATSCSCIYFISHILPVTHPDIKPSFKNSLVFKTQGEGDWHWTLLIRQYAFFWLYNWPYPATNGFYIWNQFCLNKGGGGSTLFACVRCSLRWNKVHTERLAFLLVIYTKSSKLTQIEYTSKQVYLVYSVWVHHSTDNKAVLTAKNVQDECFQSTGVRVQELCERGGARPGLPVPKRPYGLCGRKAALYEPLVSAC